MGGVRYQITLVYILRIVSPTYTVLLFTKLEEKGNEVHYPC